jgi:hypothetical protein
MQALCLLAQWNSKSTILYLWRNTNVQCASEFQRSQLKFRGQGCGNGLVDVTRFARFATPEKYMHRIQIECNTPKGSRTERARDVCMCESEQSTSPDSFAESVPWRHSKINKPCSYIFAPNLSRFRPVTVRGTPKRLSRRLFDCLVFISSFCAKNTNYYNEFDLTVIRIQFFLLIFQDEKIY